MNTFGFLLFVCLSCRLAAAGSPVRVVEWGENMAGGASGAPGEYTSGVVTLAEQTLTDATEISAGLWYSLALKSDGSVFGWGSGMARITARNGQIMIKGQALTNVVAISACQESLALLRNGSLIAWERSGAARIITNLIGVTEIASGVDYYAALRKEGTIFTWGEGNPPPAWLTNVSAVAVSKSFAGHGLALTKERTVIAWALGHGSSCFVRGATNVVAIAAGQTHYLALTHDGMVCEWGYYAYPNLAGNGLTGIPANDLSSHIVEVNGKRLTDIVAIAAGASHSLALKRDGTIIAWGIDRQRKGTTPVQLDVPAGLRGVIAISAGDGFSLALTTNNPALPAPTFKR